MFNRKAYAKARELLLHLVRKHYKHIDEFNVASDLWTVIDQIDNATVPLIHSDNVAVLIGIEKSGRLLTFKFKRGSDVFEIETYGSIADNVPLWKRQANLS